MLLFHISDCIYLALQLSPPLPDSSNDIKKQQKPWDSFSKETHKALMPILHLKSLPPLLFKW